MNAKTKEQLTSIGGTYLRAFITGAVTAFTLGKTEPKDFLTAGMAAIIPLIMRWANPKDAFPKKG
jgi:CBS-domain-containing membrane protein